ncbi:uncharacterized protein LOC142551379 isoform X1 [Primulina tabacum]|uniref:uncharacterized protein LOC142551379 isoform X1 n=1 Tax=Primulina tabacum TaxID=48773 RepID=UPI003F5A0235
MADSASPQSISPASLSDADPKSIPNSKNTVHIGGLLVEFPYRPYGSQLAFMNRVISTLDRSQRDGHCHALLESPTGTGKSLSLLCSALSWQQNQKSKNIQANLMHSSSRANPEAVSDPINHGGGFIPETQPSGNPGVPPPPATGAKKEKPKLAPTIFYSSRTHSQITQVIREYKKTSYRVPMAVLGSRKHYCTNPYVRGEENVDEQCKLLLKNTEDTCPEFKNVHKVKGHPSLQKGGCHEVHDIEDLVKVGQVVKGCSYFAARSMAQDAELVFCPYNYIMNPIIREAMEVDIDGSVIIFDEAHNIEDIARDAGSIDVEEEALLHLQTDLGQLSLNDAMTYQPLFEMMQDILSWIDRRKNTLVKREFQRYFRCWTGDKALKELHEANISLQNFSILGECAKKAIKAASEAEPDIPHLSGIAATTLEGLFSSLSYFFGGNGIHAYDYELGLQRYMQKGGWTVIFSLWCLNPAVIFKTIAEFSQSVILTSGTLSPLNTFSSELGVQFGTCLEAPHIIDVDSQVWAAAIAHGPGNYPLNASYKTADEYAFQDEVGTSLEEICKVVPGGCLVFFPSYKLLDKLSTRWQETGQWSRLNAQKSLFVEPRGAGQDALEPVLKGFYNTIQRGSKQVNTRKIRSKTSGLKNGMMTLKEENKEGAAFLAVCRGKVSEGMDFSDDNARAVVIVGIPFPNSYDIKVAQKKKFNDTYELSKNLLNGNEWYCQQAFRALNQATGRCIRHRFDYGAIIYLDERFHKDRNRTNISKWLRDSIKLYSCFEESISSLKSFFGDVKDRIANSSQNSAIDNENVNTVDEKKGTRKKSHKVIKSDKHNSLTTQTRGEVVKIMDKKESGVREYIDLEFDTGTDSRWSVTPSVAPSPDDLVLTVIQETPGINAPSLVKTLEFFSKHEYSSPRADHGSMVLPEPSSFQPTSLRSSYAGPIKELVTTPETKANNIQPEADSPWSVNSHGWKRRKFTGLPSSGSVRTFNTPPFSIPDSFGSLASSVTTTDVNHRTDELIHSENKFDKDKSFPSSSLNNFVGSYTSYNLNMDQSLQIFCSICRNPLGLPENNLGVKCSPISSSKGYLTSLWKKPFEAVAAGASSVDVLVSDASSIDKRLCGTAREGASGQGIWCKEDGCVYDSIFCPFCVDLNNCLGVLVVATDASNIEFQNKILFYRDHLEIKKFEATQEKALSPPDKSITGKKAGVIPIENFAYISPTQDSGGWKHTRSRIRLPNKS